MIHMRDATAMGETAEAESMAAYAAVWRPRAIGVLPFINVTGHPRVDALSDGITQEITDACASFNGFELDVRRCTLFPSCTNVHYGDLGWCLDVALLLLGNVRETKGVLVTSAQLICVSNGSSVWSGCCCCDGATMFTVADEIAAQIARALN